MKVDVDYYNSDKSVSRSNRSYWEKTDLHCLICGNKGLYSEDEWDSEPGFTHICLKCGYYFTLSIDPSDGNEDPQKKQVLEQLKKE